MTFTNKLVSSNSFKSELGQQTHTVYYIIRVSNVFFLYPNQNDTEKQSNDI